jgi:hypothetical protein
MLQYDCGTTMTANGQGQVTRICTKEGRAGQSRESRGRGRGRGGAGRRVRSSARLGPPVGCQNSPEFTSGVQDWLQHCNARRKRVAATRQFRVLVTAATPKSDVAYTRGIAYNIHTKVQGKGIAYPTAYLLLLQPAASDGESRVVCEE